MKPLKLLPVFLSSMALATALPEIYKKNDFAYNREIEITDNKSVIDVYLNEDIYKTSKVFGFADMAVFNAKNEMVTHQTQFSKVSKIEMARDPEMLKVFPIESTVDDGESNFGNIKVVTNAQGSVLEIKNNSTKEKNSKTKIGFLVDAAAFEGKIRKLKLNFSKFPSNEFIQIRVDGSSDLISWNRVDSESVLAQFEMQGEAIIKNEIPIRVTDARYFRIVPLQSKSEVIVESVSAFLGTETKTVFEEMHWLNGNSTKVSELVYQFDLEGSFPIETIKLDFADKNSLATIQMQGSYEPGGPWRDVKTAKFFLMSNETGIISELQTNFIVSPYRYWQLKVISSAAGMGSQFPKIQFGWRPEFVRFLARGEGPFTLAYGNAKAKRDAPHDFDPEFLKTTGSGTLKEKVIAGGENLLTVDAPEKYPMKKITLWGVLILGVLLLVGMIRQTKKI